MARIRLSKGAVKLGFLTAVLFTLFFFVLNIKLSNTQEFPPAEKNPYIPNWKSPSDWLYVKQVGDEIHTAYGNFTYSKDGINMFKDGELLGTLRVGVVGDISKEVPTNNLVCSNNICNLTLSYANSKILVIFDKLKAEIIYEYENKELTSNDTSFYFELETPSKLSVVEHPNANITVFENGMQFDVSDLASITKDGKSIINNTQFKDGKLRVETNKISLSSKEKIFLDPTWTTPTVITSSCGATNVNNLIDGNTATFAYHSVSEWHNVVFDMGSSVAISGFRLYLKSGTAYGGGTFCLSVFISTDTTFTSNEAVMGNQSFQIGAGTEGWVQNITVPSTSGRYIKITANGFSSSQYKPNCQIAYEQWYNTNFSEFNAYVTIPDTTAPIVTIQQPTNTTNSTNSIWANVTLDEAGSWCGLNIDNTVNETMANSTKNWNHLMTALSDKTHSVRFYCNDTTGNMNGSASNVKYFTTDITAPTYSSNYTNSTVAGTPIQFDLKWGENVTLNKSITSLWNGSAWVNATTWCSLSGTSSWCNQTFFVNTTAQTLWWKGFANNSAGLWNTSINYSLVTTSAACNDVVLNTYFTQINFPNSEVNTNFISATGNSAKTYNVSHTASCNGDYYIKGNSNYLHTDLSTNIPIGNLMFNSSLNSTLTSMSANYWSFKTNLAQTTNTTLYFYLNISSQKAGMYNTSISVRVNATGT